MGVEPFSVGDAHARRTDPSPAVAVNERGARASGRGVAVATVDAGPMPSALIAAILKLYSLPLVRPVATYRLADADAVEVSVVHPVVVLRCTR